MVRTAISQSTTLLRRLWAYLNTDQGPLTHDAPRTGSLLHHAIAAGGSITTHDMDRRLDDLKPYEAAGLLTVYADSAGPWATCEAEITLTKKGREKFGLSLKQ